VKEKKLFRRRLLLLLLFSLLSSQVFADVLKKKKLDYYKDLNSEAFKKISVNYKSELFEKSNENLIVYYKKEASFKEKNLKKERETTFFERKKVSEKSKRRWKRAVNKVILINKVLKSFKNFPIKLVNVKSNEEKVTLLNNKDVLFVGRNERHKLSLRESLPLINQPDVRSMGHRGEGTSVVVIDTGIDYKKKEFGQCKLPEQRSFIPKGNCKVVFSKDFSSTMNVGLFEPKDDGKLDDSGHGTNVAGIISNIAPDTKLISLDVFTKIKIDGKVKNLASTSDIIEALDWVLENKIRYNIVAVNLSLGGPFSYKKDCSKDNYHYSQMFKKLLKASIIPVVAAGNEGHSAELGAPGCVKSALTVGSVKDTTDTVSDFSNGGPLVDILAPGESILAAGIRMSGTSQATPHVTGAIAILKGNRYY